MDFDKQEIDDEFALVLELPKSAPLFMRKKKLLDDMGFDSKIHARLKCSSISAPHQLNDFLNRLIQQARIINFDEVEIYFHGDNMRDYSNPRNELLALNYLLEAIDNSLSSDKHKMKNVMQNLRDEIVDRIHNVGSKFGEDSNFVGCSNWDKEKCLLDWAVDNGARTKLDIAYIEGAGRGAIARQDLKVGDIALEIPVSIIISEELVHESKMFPILNGIDGISTETMLLLWCMKEKYNKNSRFKLFFETLPEKFNTGLSFGIDAIMNLDGTLLLEEIVQAKEHLRVQYEELFPALSDLHPDIFPPELYTWQHFLWACELFYSNSMKVVFTDGKLRTCLIPVAGFLNHSVCPHALRYGRIEASTHSLRFPLARTCHAGEQCFLGYGNFSSSHLLTFYGFLPQGDNPYDVIPLEFDRQDEDCEDGRTAPEWLTHLVRGTWYSEDHGIFQYGLPTPLLYHLRRARNQNWRSSTITQEILETELDVLRDLNSTFQDRMDALGDDNLDDRERTSWDVRLALEYKNLQRKIVSSILTSCRTGCELLECELLKFTEEFKTMSDISKSVMGRRSPSWGSNSTRHHTHTEVAQVRSKHAQSSESRTHKNPNFSSSNKSSDSRIANGEGGETREGVNEDVRKGCDDTSKHPKRSRVEEHGAPSKTQCTNHIFVERVNHKEKADSFWDLNDLEIRWRKGRDIVGDFDIPHLLSQSTDSSTHFLAWNACQVLSLAFAFQVREESLLDVESELRDEVAKLKGDNRRLSDENEKANVERLQLHKKLDNKLKRV